jgi:hypothetical protein
MKFNKILAAVVVFILGMFMSPFAVIANPQDTAANENTPEELITPHPFYDAQILDEAYENGTIKMESINAVLKVLSKYARDEALREHLQKDWQDVDAAKLKEQVYAQKEFGENPFLKGYIEALFVTLKAAPPPPTRLVRAPTATVKQIIAKVESAPVVEYGGLLSPTMVVQAMASVVAKRFKEELAIAFLDDFKELLEKEGWGLIFPSTASFLTSTDTFNFKVFIPTLKEVFRDDLKNIDLNLLKYLTWLRNQQQGNDADTRSIERSSGSLIKDERVLNLAIFALDLIHSIRAGKHPAQIIDNLDKSEYFELLDPKFSNPLRLLALVSRNLKNKEGDGWINPAAFKIFIKDSGKNIRELFIGLIYAREMAEMDKIIFAGKSIRDILYNNEEKIRQVNDYIHRITIIAEEIRDRIKQLKEKNKIGFEEYNAYLDIIYELFELGFDIKEFAGYDRTDETVKKYLGYTRNILEIAKNIYESAYGVALVNAVSLLEAILPKAHTIREILKYGTFMISMVNARDADEMEKLIESVALPVKGYRIKRSSPFSISLNVYPGIFGGRETLTTKERIIGDKPEWMVSFAAPIGLAFSWGRGNYDKPGPSWSLFLSAVDIGAPVSWRLTGEDKGLPELTWENIFAPGVFIIYGIKNFPLSIGAGIQYGPQLREIKGPAEAVIESGAFRFGLLIAVDIPIFNLYSKI